jgi:hypothetical protein
MNYYGIYAQHLFKIPGGRWVINDGIRFQAVDLRSTIADNSAFKLPFTEIRQENTAVTGNIGAIYMPNENIASLLVFPLVSEHPILMMQPASLNPATSSSLYPMKISNPNTLIMRISVCQKHSVPFYMWRSTAFIPGSGMPLPCLHLVLMEVIRYCITMQEYRCWLIKM